MKVRSVFTCSALVTVAIHRHGGQSTAAGSGGIPTETTTEEQPTLRMIVEKLSGGQAKRTFGDQSEARWRGTADSDADLQVNDLLVLETGPYIGTVLQVDDIRVPAGMLMVVELADTDKVPD